MEAKRGRVKLGKLRGLSFLLGQLGFRFRHAYFDELFRISFQSQNSTEKLGFQQTKFKPKEPVRKVWSLTFSMYLNAGTGNDVSRCRTGNNWQGKQIS